MRFVTWTKLKVILWKNLLLRKHHWTYALIEITSPTFFMLILHILAIEYDFMDRPKNITTTYNPQRKSTDLYKLFSKEFVILYTPNTSFTQSLVLSGSELLDINSANVIAFDNETELNDYLSDFKGRKVIGVVFHNLTDDLSQLSHLHYVIRPYKYHYLTKDLFRKTDEVVPDTGSLDFFRNGFIPLKIALDLSYINMLGKMEPPVEIVMQEFPYPPFYNEFIDFQAILPHWIFISYIGFYVIVIHRIVEEKQSGSKRLMLSMGLRKHTLWFGWFLDTLIINIFSNFIITCLLVFPMWGESVPLLSYSNGVLLFLFLLTYTVAGTVFAFALGSFVTKNTIADIIGIITLVTLYLLGMFIISKGTLSRGSKFLLMLYPHFGLYYGFKALSVFEERKIGLHLNNLFTCPYESKDCVEIGYIFLMLFLDIILYFQLTTSMEKIKPGLYEAKTTLNFPFLFRKYFYFTRVQTNKEIMSKMKFYKVDETPNLVVGVRVKNVTKSYGYTVALNNVTMDIYKGQITVLVGHKESGKSLLMDIIGGMDTPSSGDVYIQDRNIKRVLGVVRTAIGYCPEHNLKFLSLSVKEHLVFFGILKGVKIKTAYKSANFLLKRLNLYEKRHYKAYRLPYELQRKLSVAIALSGKPKILILDEPTLGLNMKSRRIVWDLIISMRSTRVVLVSTKSMEEARIFGDRIAVINHGCLICYGTSSFLEKEFGAHYDLQITFNQTGFGLAGLSNLLTDNSSSNEENTTKIIEDIIPTATLQSRINNTISFFLPYEAKHEYTKLIDEINSHASELHIKDFKVKAVTVEDMFMRVDEMILKDYETNTLNAVQQRETDEADKSFIVAPPKKLKKSKKIINHWHCLIMKKIWLERKRWYTLLFGLLLVIAATVLTLVLTDNSININKLTDNVYFNLNKYDKTKVVYSGLGPLDVEKYKNQYKNLILNHTTDVQEVSSVSKELLSIGRKDIEFYRRFLVVAAQFNSTENGILLINAMYSNPATYGAPISLSLIVNTILKVFKGDSYSITTAINFSPFLVEQKSASKTHIPIFWTIFIPIALLIYCERFLFFPITEKRTRIKHLQLMCGVRSFTYWSVCFIWDFFIYLIAATIVILLVGLTINLEEIFSRPKEVQTFFLILLAYGFSMISYIYVYSHSFLKSGSYFHLLVTTLGVCFLMATTVILVQQLKKLFHVLSCVFCIFPQFGLFYCVFKFSYESVQNYNRQNQLLSEKYKRFYRSNQSYLSGEDGIGCHLLVMFLSTLFYLFIITIMEAKFTSKWSERRLIHLNKTRANLAVDSDLSQESERIMEIFSQEVKRPKEILEMYKNNGNADFYLVNCIKKMYGIMRVVKGVSFVLNRGDCFGILGASGSGKTSIFRVLTGLSPVNIGGARIYANNQFFYLYKNYKRYLQFIGYCPQNNLLLNILTGRELLYFFAKVRGVTVKTKVEVAKWINLIGLEECADKLCQYYNTGEKRKLSVGIALVGSPLIVMLDEPTRDVDPISRKRLWKVIRTLKNQEFKPCIILTSSSTEECEALCNKMAILHDGQFECLGTIPSLKEQYACGFMIKIKLKNAFLSEFSNKSVAYNELLPGIDEDAFEQLLLDCNEKFSGSVTSEDKYSGLLSYHVTDKTKKWNDLFKEMNELKNRHYIIEDFDVTGITLEDTFVSMSKSSKPR